MSPAPFTNNLTKNDRVYDTVAQRQGKVARTPHSRSTAIIYDGTNTQRYVDVTRLRFMVNGQPEEEPPIEGVPPAAEEKTEKALPTGSGDCLSVAKAQLATNNAEKEKLTARFKILNAENERLEQVVKLLSS